MLSSKRYTSILVSLEQITKEQFIPLFEIILKAALNIIQNTEELREEIMDYEDIYQIHIDDLDFDFWVRISKGEAVYQSGINPESSLRINTSKEILIKILKQEVSGADVYMKGVMKAHGTLKHAIKFRNLVKLCFDYINAILKKKIKPNLVVT